MTTKRTLLLSSIYEPITFIDDRRAISLLIRDVVEVVSEWKDEVMLKSFGPRSTKLCKPAVLRLTHSNSRPARIPTFRRTVVFARDDWRCQYCDKNLTQRDASIDHVMPQSRGGPTSWRNCVTACKRCNRLKDNKTPEEAGMVLRRQPTAPTLTHLWGVKAGNATWHETWESFLPR